MPRAVSLHRYRLIRLSLAAFVMLTYIAVDGSVAARSSAWAQWDLQQNRSGVVTWVAPSGPADIQGIQVGDRLQAVSGPVSPAPVLHVWRHHRWLRFSALATQGTSASGQALVLVGGLWLLIGLIAWCFSRQRRTPLRLNLLTASTALTLLAVTWGQDGHLWAVILEPLGSAIVFPVAWATFFLSFPHHRLGERPWQIAWGSGLALATASLALYAGVVVGALPPALYSAGAALNLLYGFALGIVSVAARHRQETEQTRQQRRLIAWSAVGALGPFVLLTAMPSYLFSGLELLPYSLTVIPFAMLPFGLAYAMMRYDLMGLNIVVRRLVTLLVSGLLLLGISLPISVLLRHFALPSMGVALPLIAVISVVGWHWLGHWVQRVVEHLLDPELVRARRLLVDLDAVVLHGDTDLLVLEQSLEGAAMMISGAPWARLLVRQRVAGAIFRQPGDSTMPVAMPHLAVALAERPWGLLRREASQAVTVAEWVAVTAALPAAPTLLVPLCLRRDVIGLLALGERPDDRALSAPDQEALALLAAYCALPIDHGRVRADVEAERADAAAYTAACAELTMALGQHGTLPRTIVTSLSTLRDVCATALFMRDQEGAWSFPTTLGAVPPPSTTSTQLDSAAVIFALSPTPHAWIPLTVGSNWLGTLYVAWQPQHVLHEYDRRLLTVFADSAALVLEQARLYEQAREQAERDSITALYNHRAFHARLTQTLDQAAGKDEVGVLLLDLVDFKLFNDTHGHQAGDKALQSVGEVLNTCSHPVGSAGRLGGDEFALLLPHHTLDMTRAMAERINDLVTISALILPGNQTIPLRLSIGVSVFPADGETPEALLARADERMYEAKRTGVAIATVGPTATDNPSDEIYGTYDLLQALVAMVDNRDSYTAEHSAQVATYASALGHAVGLPPTLVDTLHVAGLLHDVGKIGLPNRILRKPGRLSDEEFAIIRRHVELSETLITAISPDPDLLDAVRYHHERWDGSGYPRRLVAEEVPLLGRIMIIADAVSAMGMDRPYRKGLSWEVIATELQKHAGRQFDPALIGPALRALESPVKRLQGLDDTTDLLAKAAG